MHICTRLTGWRSSCRVWRTLRCLTSRSTPSRPTRWPGRPWRWGHFPLFFVILPSSLKNLGLFFVPSECSLFFTFSKFLKLLICLLFNHFFGQACEQEAASSKKVSFPITQRWPWCWRFNKLWWMNMMMMVKDNDDNDDDANNVGNNVEGATHCGGGEQP